MFRLWFLGCAGFVRFRLGRAASTATRTGGFGNVLGVSGRLSPPTAAQRAVPPPIHASDQAHAHHDRASPPHDQIAIEYDGPEGADKQEALPRVAGAPGEQASERVEREDEWVAVGEGAGDLRRGGEQERTLLVDEDGGAAGGSGWRVGGEGDGREGGIGRRRAAS